MQIPLPPQGGLSGTGLGLGGPPPFAGPPQAPPPSGETTGPQQILRTMLQLATVYHSVETNDVDRLKVEKVTTLLQEILADHQAQQDKLLGGNVSALRRLGG